MYAAGAKGNFDALSFHPYSSASPLALGGTAPAIHRFVRSVPALHDRMLRVGDTRPIWITEAGWATAAAGGACALAGGLTSEADQARFLADELHASRGWGYVAGFLEYELFDRGPGASC